MKKLLIIMGVFLIGITSSFRPAAIAAKSITSGPFEEVINALKKGDVNGLAAYFDNTVELTLAGKSEVYSKTQAIAILKDFYTKNAAKSFELIHQGEGGGGSRFGIGNLGTSGATYRVSFFLQKKNGSLILNELRFENKQ